MALLQEGRDNWQLGGIAPAVVRTGLVVGILGLLVSVYFGFISGPGPARFFHSYLINFCFYLSLALGALFFVLLQHLVGATWSVTVRRLAETISANLWLMGLLFVPILFGLEQLYTWADPEIVAADALIQSKSGYLNVTFFIIRSIIYFAVWIFLSTYFHRKSLAQDQSGDLGITLKLEGRSAPAMLAFAITLTFASFDYLMSLEPHWFSTIFGVYYFSGAMFGFFALLPLLVFLLQKNGRMKLAVSPEHFHDLGKWMFAFVVFWAYIGFSQYMLIWYSNLPEETFWYHARQSGHWTRITLLLLFGHFLIPFFGLLPRTVKKVSALLAFWSVWMLVMHWFDLYWLALPRFSPEDVPFHLLDFTCFIGMGGLFFALAAHRLRDSSLVAEGDPRLHDSLGFENA